ncbi:MAG: YfhO family protein [Anaerolineae bacterium]|nr:YfhO family protein [Anaerolineae bacterium]
MTARPGLRGSAVGWRSLGTAAAIGLLPFLLFWRLLTPVAADRAYLVEGDLSSQYLPLRVYAATRLAQGEIPLWSPYVFGGQPGLADIQTALLYPPNLVWLAFRGPDFGMQDLQLQAVLHLSLAAVGMYWLAHRLSSSRLGGAVAGAAFVLGGCLTSFPVQQITILSTAAWLPWLLLLLDQALEGRFPLARGGAAVAAITALTVLAGHPQTAMLAAYAALGYVLWRRHWTHPTRARMLTVAGGALLGLALTAVQLLPTLEFMSLSTRSSLGFEAATVGFGLHEIAGLLYPGYFGGTPQYAGAVVLLLATAAALSLPWRETGYWLGLGLAGLLLSFGGSTALGPLIYILLPGFSASRNQERTVLWLALALAVLAGLGAARVAMGLAAEGSSAGRARRFLRRATAVAVAFGGLLLAGTGLPAPDSGVNLFGGFLKQHVWLVAGLGLSGIFWHWRARGHVSDHWLATAFALLLAANLASVNWRYHLGEASPAVSRPGASLSALLRTRLQPGQRASTGGLLPEGPNAGLLYGFADTTGNTPLRLQSYARFQERVAEWRQWQLLSVAIVLLPSSVQPERDPSADPGQALALVQSGEPSVYALRQPAPAVRLVHQLERARDEEVWELLAGEHLDPSQVAVVSPEAEVSVMPATIPPTLAYVTWEPERVEAGVTVSSPGLAVFSQVAYPGWTAYVDGRPTEWVLADGLFLAVPVPAGTHVVALEYRPGSFRAGAGLSAVALVLTAALTVRPCLLHRWELHP